MCSERYDHNFRVSSWNSLLAMLLIAMTLVSGFSWAVRVNERLDRYVDMQASMRERFLAEVASIKTQLDKGILPVTEVRVAQLESDLAALREQMSGILRERGKKQQKTPLTQGAL